MFYGAKAAIFANAKLLRDNMTPAENRMWGFLKENQFGVRFKPQHPIDIFIADFYCHKLKLVIEIDGEIHEKQKEYDADRTSELLQHNIEIIRFTNAEVMYSIDRVLEKIKIKIAERKLWACAL